MERAYTLMGGCAMVLLTMMLGGPALCGEDTAGGAAREEAALKKAAEDTEKNRKSNAIVRVVDAKGAPVAGATVSVGQTRHDFLFGCNIYMFGRYQKPEENEAYKKHFQDLLNYATTGFYWKSYEPERGKPNYAYTDKVVAWCTERGIRLKGHPLLWGHEAGVPTWSKGQPAPDIQKQRVVDILKRYTGKIEFWEVVNEPAHIGNVKIDEPYRWAREANPKGYLIVNDYYVMANGFPPFFKLLEQAKANGVPFEGTGIQAHEPRTMRFPLERVQETLDHYATLGKELHITEFTPCSGGENITGSHVTGKWDEAAQADYAVKFYRVCFAHPALRAITWWDLCDHGAWLKGGGMLRADLTPKPVYEALKKLIHEEWQTRAEGQTDATGAFAFRGFYGQYQVQAKGAGGSATATFNLAKGEANELKVAVP
jgi:GH35 family endo-1,4-beta-xylanase